MTRRIVALALSVAIVGHGIAPTIDAALFFEFKPSRAAPGGLVTGRSVGNGSMSAAAGMRLPIALVLVGDSEGALFEIGAVVVDSLGDGRTSFVVPRVDVGQYEVWIHCEPCRPTSAGRADLPIGTLTVIPGTPATDTASAPPRPEMRLVYLLVLSLSLGGLLVLLRRIRG